MPRYPLWAKAPLWVKHRLGPRAAIATVLATALALYAPTAQAQLGDITGALPGGSTGVTVTGPLPPSVYASPDPNAARNLGTAPVSVPYTPLVETGGSIVADDPLAQNLDGEANADDPVLTAQQAASVTNTGLGNHFSHPYDPIPLPGPRSEDVTVPYDPIPEG